MLEGYNDKQNKDRTPMELYFISSYVMENTNQFALTLDGDFLCPSLPSFSFPSVPCPYLLIPSLSQIKLPQSFSLSPSPKL